MTALFVSITPTLVLKRNVFADNQRYEFIHGFPDFSRSDDSTTICIYTVIRENQLAKDSLY